MILMLLTCVAMVGAFFFFVGRSAGSLNPLAWLIVLICPLVHLFMHRGHGGHE